MKSEKSCFGLKELVALGVGGMIGGGIFSVLGLAVSICGHAAPLAFLIGGLIALTSSYSYVKLALVFHSDGSSFTYMEHAFPSKPNIAGILGWVIVVGYIGTLALYATTFGIYSADLIGLPDSPYLRLLLASLVLLIFLIINLLGVKETGISQDIIVYLKIVLLFFLGLMGFASINTSHYVPLFNKGHFSVFSAAAIVFVAYEGFQLITNAVCESENPQINIPRSIYLSIIIVTSIYLLLSCMSIGNLTEFEFQKYGEYALAVAISPQLGKLGRVAVDISAMFATTSAINATLFGSARMAAEIATENMMPKIFSLHNNSHIPWVSLILITIFSLIFTLFSGLEIIATFSSETFLLVSIGVTITNLKLRKATHCSLWITLSSLTLMLVSLGLLFWYLATQQSNTLILTAVIYTVITVLELSISKRKPLILSQFIHARKNGKK